MLNTMRSDGCHVQPLSGKKTKFKGSTLDRYGHIMHRRSEGMSDRRNKGSYLQERASDGNGRPPPLKTEGLVVRIHRRAQFVKFCGKKT